jgi:hypothetical protein
MELSPQPIDLLPPHISSRHHVVHRLVLVKQPSQTIFNVWLGHTWAMIRSYGLLFLFAASTICLFLL